MDANNPSPPPCIRPPCAPAPENPHDAPLPTTPCSRRPLEKIHRGMTPAARRQAGIGDGRIRLSAGLEAADDLLADLEQALQSP